MYLGIFRAPAALIDGAIASNIHWSTEAAKIPFGPTRPGAEHAISALLVPRVNRTRL